MTNPRPALDTQNTVKKNLTPAPGDWLLARYDATGPRCIGACDEDTGEFARPGCIQPMFTLKSPYDPGEPMRVTASDYGDTGRWWL